MICGMTYFQICLYFLIYSFGGWVVEVIFHAVALGKVINRGFLNGPVCPVYGFGVISVFALLNTIQGSGHQMSDGMIFVFGIVLATAVELIAGWLLDVCFHARWWDYSDKPFNFHGYICLEFSLIWGLAIVMVVKVFQKYVEAHASYTPNSQSELRRLEYRMHWEEDFLAYLLKLQESKPVICCGDFNVAHKEIDLKNPKTNRKNAGFTDEERASFDKVLESGFIDTFRYFYPDAEGRYSWWSYRFKAREKNAGWRIDYFITSPQLKDKLEGAEIHSEIMGSDHCPVELQIAL